MPTTIAYIIDSVVNVFYICFWFIVLGREYIYPLKQDIDDLTNTQDILYRSIQTLKTITDIDKQHKTDLCEEENKDSEEENKDSEEEDICPNIEVLPIQNHITFPQFIIFNDDNYKVSRTKSRDRELKNDTRILSEQVDKFLDKKIGTCMTFDETYELIWQYIGLHCNIGTQCHLKGFTKYIELDPNLRQLFGITEYEDYELTTETLPKYLEPHLKRLINV